MSKQKSAASESPLKQNRIVPLDKLVEHPRNYRVHPKAQIDKLVLSLQRFGQGRSIVCQDGPDKLVIVAGHGVFEAAQALRWKELRADILPAEWSDAQIEGYLIADNQHSQDASENEELLAMLLQEQQNAGFDLASLGSDDEALRQMLESLGDSYLGGGEQEERDGEEDALPEQVETRCKLGQVWQLGKHRLICADAFDPVTYKILLDGVQPHAIITDPPYGMRLDVKSSDLGRGDSLRVSQHPRHYTPVIGDDEDFNPSFIFSLFDDVPEIFLWGADYYAERIPHRNDGSWLVWDKRDGVEDMEFSSSSFELCWSRQKHRRDIIRVRWSGVLGMESQDTKKRVHPTQKPLKLIEDIITRYTDEGQIILDSFLGSGTTLISAERTGRICYGCELSPAYCDVVISRWEKETNQQAQLLERVEVPAHA